MFNHVLKENILPMQKRLFMKCFCLFILCYITYVYCYHMLLSYVAIIDQKRFLVGSIEDRTLDLRVISTAL